MIKKISFIILALISVMFFSSAHAEIMVGESIEWLVDSSDIIAQYKTTNVTLKEKSNTWSYSNVRAVLLTSFKGKAPPNITFKYYSQGKVQKEATFLVFFNIKEEKSIIRYYINLSNPNIRGFRSVAFTKDFKVLKTEKEIIETTKNRIQLNRPVDMAFPEKAANVFPPPSKTFLLIEAPSGTEAWKVLYSKSTCYLVIPADEEFKVQLFQELKSKNVWTRAHAASWLVAYPDEDTVKILHSSLIDEGTAVITASGANKTVYPVRQAAYKALSQLGIEVEKPKGFDDNLPDSFLH